jgi:hypothetical protein
VLMLAILFLLVGFLLNFFVYVIRREEDFVFLQYCTSMGFIIVAFVMALEAGR